MVAKRLGRTEEVSLKDEGIKFLPGSCAHPLALLVSCLSQTSRLQALLHDKVPLLPLLHPTAQDHLTTRMIHSALLRKDRAAPTMSPTAALDGLSCELNEVKLLQHGSVFVKKTAETTSVNNSSQWGLMMALDRSTLLNNETHSLEAAILD